MNPIKKINPNFETLKILAYSLLKIPLLYACKPQMVSVDEKHCHVKIPYKRKTRNPMGSFYLGAFCMGADLACGYLANYFVQKHQQKARFIFNDLEAHFLKMAKSDVHFVCKNGEEIEKAILECIHHQKKTNCCVEIESYCHQPQEKVADFKMNFAFTPKKR